MKCKVCDATLKVHRRCRQVRLKCSKCQKEYQVHEVAADLDPEIEAELERYTCIIYD